jgi:hypothetical protein
MGLPVQASSAEQSCPEANVHGGVLGKDDIAPAREEMRIDRNRQPGQPIAVEIGCGSSSDDTSGTPAEGTVLQRG